MAQQTAVEWLEEQINLTFYVAEASEMNKRFQSIYEQAKAMEKEQMYQVWKTSEEWSDGKLLDSKKSFEEYYNETYNK